MADTQMSMAELIKEVVIRSYNQSFEWGYPGRPTGDGTYEFEVPGRANFWFVRIFRGSTVTVDQAVNFGVARDPNLPVLVGRDPNGERYIQGVMPSIAAQALVGKAAQAAPPHTHAIGSGLEETVESLRLEPGLVTPAGGTTVRIKSFDYLYQGNRNRYEGGVLDLASALPSTAGTWAWVVVSLDPSDGSINADTGSEYGSKAALTEPRKNQVYIPGQYPLMGIKTYESQTVFNDIRDFSDCRLLLGEASPFISWIGITGLIVSTGSSAEGRTFQSTASTPTVNDDVDLGYGLGSLWYDTSGGHLYICADGTNGAAVWKDLG